MIATTASMIDIEALRGGVLEQPAAPSPGVYHFLDMGGQKYGDCAVVSFGSVHVLIDGGHAADLDGQPGAPAIPVQLGQIFGTPPPFKFALVVVTHCHADHVGCLPELVARDIVQPEWALVTHPGLGFGRAAKDESSRADLASSQKKTLAAALREEDASDLAEPELDEFLGIAATVEDRYGAMLAHLKARGVKVVEYVGGRLPPDLAALLAPTGMQLLGPSQSQLLQCAEQIAKTNQDAADAVAAVLARGGSLDVLALYRQLVRAQAESDRGASRGAAMNCQSITLCFGAAGSRALLGGDMQFTQAAVPGLDEEMRALRQIVIEAGPYKLFKTTHHSSPNGQNDALLNDLGNPPLIVHSGGLRDASHPDPGILRMLGARAAAIRFARTDRNGLTTVRPALEMEQAMDIRKGGLNDFTDKVRDLATGSAPPAAPPPVITAPPEVASEPRPRPGPQIIIVNLPPGPIDMSVGGVEIVVRAASARPGTQQQDATVQVSLGKGRKLPALLFVTNSARLSRNIGSAGAAAALAAVGAPHELLEVDGSEDTILAAVRQKLTGGTFHGVVLIGGYDVVPSIVADVLTASLRSNPAVAASQDGDGFFIWTDELFGDVNGDSVAEYPVSRIPDGRDAGLVLTALQVGEAKLMDRFGIRNVKRPFADQVWSLGGENPAIKVSEKFTSGDVAPSDTTVSYHYYMLHGNMYDATRFSGEYADGTPGYPVGFELGNVPAAFTGIVFSGCCWSALTVSARAAQASEGAVAARTASDSIALAYLKAGANAFVGCTGSHYSGPSTDPRENAALEFHQGFWHNVARCGMPAAVALHTARLDFGRHLAENSSSMDPLQLARCLKNRSQFTCLGLGW